MQKKNFKKRHKWRVIIRFKQILAITIAVQSLCILASYFFNFSTDIIACFVCSIVVMGLLFTLANEEKVEKAKQIYIWTNLFITGFLFYKSGGMLALGPILGFPILLMISALVFNSRIFIAVIIYTMAVVGFVGLSTINKWTEVQTPEFSYWHLATTLIMMSVAAYTAWRFSADLKHALKKLKVEVANVNESHDKIEKLIHNDPLTGLSSRLDCKEKYEQLCKTLDTDKNRIYFLFLDIDNFKSVNDYYSHSFGDKLLVNIAQQLRSMLNEEDIACRLSGDEFLLIVSRPLNYNIDLLAQVILKHLAQPIDILDYRIEVTLSIGGTIVEYNADEFELVLKRADLAMHRSKQAGKNQFSMYDNEILNQSRRKIDIISGLKSALKNNDLELFLQPKVDITTGKIRSVEALIRWVRNNPYNVSPGEFIPLIESTELICSIGEWVICNSCRLCKELQENGFEDITVSVNISAAQFARGNLEQILIDELAEHDLSPESLELELTEHTLFQDDETVLDELSRVKNLGLSLSIDDFGTGYSNLGYLTKLKVDILKIDRSFIMDIHKQPDNFAIVDAVLKMAGTLGLKVVAEGVETEDEWEKLKELNCDYGQGYLWSRPVPINDFLKLSPSIDK